MTTIDMCHYYIHMHDSLYLCMSGTFYSCMCLILHAHILSHDRQL